MGELVQGIPASPGIVIGPARVVLSPVLNVPHATVPPEQVEVEVVRFHKAREEAIWDLGRAGWEVFSILRGEPYDH